MTKKTLFASFLLVAAQPLGAALVVDFDTPGALTNNFSSAQSGIIVQSTTGGLNNSGSLDLSAITGGATAQQIWTLTPSFAGNLSSWSMSIYYHGNGQKFWQFGVTSEAAPALDSGYAYSGAYLPYIAFGSGDLNNGAIGFTNYSPLAGSGEYGATVDVPGDIPTTAAWYRYDVGVTYLGSSQFSVQGTMSNANVDGTIASQLATVTSVFTNPELAADPSAHIFFNLYDGVALDNFTTTAVPEPSAPLLAAGGLLIAMAGHRRRVKA